MQPIINIIGSTATIVGISSELSKELEDYFSYVPTGSDYITTKNGEDFDGVFHVFRNNRFSVGLVPEVVKILKSKSVEVTVHDHRKLGDDIHIKSVAGRMELRVYQECIVNAAIDAKSSSIELSTGGGKTLIAAEFIARLHKKAIFITPTIAILNQTYDRFNEWFGDDTDIGLVGAGVEDFRDVTIASWQTLHSQLQKDPAYVSKLEQFDVMIVDEAQHIGVNQIRKVCNRIPSIYRLGMSGTLFREDGASLEITAATGPCISRISYSELIDQEYLVPAEIKIIKTPPKYVKRRWNDYDKIYDSVIVNNDDRHELIVRELESLYKEGRKILVFVKKIDHGKNLIYHIAKSDIIGNKTWFVYGSLYNRYEIINSYEQGILPILISTQILNEGYDCPPIDALVLAAPSKSLITSIQRIGRALRPYGNKREAKIIDIFDNEPYLADHYERRFNMYRTEKSWRIAKIQNVDEHYNEIETDYGK